jgi:hypothetical protein
MALAIALSFWIGPILTGPVTDPDALVLFRQGGDPDYLPQVAAAAHLEFGEISVKEYAGTGVRAFPVAPIAAHAMLYRLAGSTGFILADILTVVLFAYALRGLLLLGKVAREPAELLSLSVISGAASWLSVHAGAAMHHSLPVMFWEFRFPRPSVTQALFVLSLALPAMLMGRARRPTWFFALFGLSFAGVLQSDIYAGFNALFVVGLAAAVVLFREEGRRAAKQLFAAAGAMALACAPFVYQQLHASPDVERRWGVIRGEGYRAMLPGAKVMAGAALVTTAAVVLAIRYARSNRKAGRLPALAAVGTAVGASILSGPASLAALHRTIQIYHFFFQTSLAIGYALLLYAGWLLTDVREFGLFGRLPEKFRSMAKGAAKAAFVGFCLTVAYVSSVRSGAADVPTAGAMQDLGLPQYRSDFGELRRVLERPEFAHATAMATFDRQLSDWWGYQRRYLFLVDLFNSTLPDSIAEGRVFQLLRMNGASREDFAGLLQNPYFLVQAMGLDKYQADSAYTAWPLDDYSAEARRRIAASSWAFHVELPESERARLLAAYDRTEGMRPGEDALDIEVLDKDSLRRYLHPESSGRFHLAWSDRTFELWAPNWPARGMLAQ